NGAGRATAGPRRPGGGIGKGLAGQDSRRTSGDGRARPLRAAILARADARQDGAHLRRRRGRTMKILMVCTTAVGKNKVGPDLGRAFAELGHPVAYYDYDERPLALRLVPKALRGEGYERRAAGSQNAALRRAV